MKIETDNRDENINELIDVLIDVKKWMIDQGILRSKTLNRVDEVLKKYEVRTNG